MSMSYFHVFVCVTYGPMKAIDRTTHLRRPPIINTAIRRILYVRSLTVIADLTDVPGGQINRNGIHIKGEGFRNGY